MQKQYCGKISDSLTGLPLPGVNVEIPLLHKTAVSNTGGTYCVQLPSTFGAELVFSKAGYQTRRIPFASLLNDTSAAVYLFPAGFNLDEIIVSGFAEQTKRLNPSQVEKIATSDIEKNGALTLCDGLSKLPGMRQLSTGTGISKPVIRGLFGNRVQIILFGLRFDNQQWQDEHGLGIATSGIEETEVTKGPATLFYGSEAMGGVVTILPEKNAIEGTTEIDVMTRVFTNTYGLSSTAGVKQSRKNLSWGTRIGYDSHADYQDGAGTRVLNSRFDNKNFKAFVQLDRKKFQSRNTYYFSAADFGFLMDAYQQFDNPDNRWARSFERPHHTVYLNLLSSENTLLLKRSVLKFNFGSVLNNRLEQEGSGGVSLNMQLNSYSGMALLTMPISTRSKLIICSQHLFQTNRNNGSRIIVPDANTSENSMAMNFKRADNHFALDAGIRFDYRSLQTFSSGNLNNGDPFKPGATILPIHKNYAIINGAIGIAYQLNKQILLKSNACTGYRSPNLAEFSSNGLHEGSFRYEIGDPNLKTEQNFCIELSAEYNLKKLQFWINGFSNYFHNYIYLQRTEEEYLGLTIYRYLQSNAKINGAETGCTYRIKPLELKVDYSFIVAKTMIGSYLPFIPANRLQTNATGFVGKLGPFQNCFIRIGSQFVFAQTKPAQFETASKSYHLLSASMGATVKHQSNKCEISVSGNNLLNQVYADHLSRLKYFNLFDIGRTISINLHYFFIS